jgi:predicted SnoaL-like aldol condensation-catalyzing enzyme
LNTLKIIACAVAFLSLMTSAYAAEPVVPLRSQEAALASKDAKLAANKQLVSEFWRTVFGGHRVDQADKFLAADFKEHAPTIGEPGIAGFKKFFQKWGETPKPIPDKINGLVDMVAEGDLVVVITVQNMIDAKGQPYTTTWLDLERIKDGKIAEHWDNQRLPGSKVAMNYTN